MIIINFVAKPPEQMVLRLMDTHLFDYPILFLFKLLIVLHNMHIRIYYIAITNF